MKTGQVLRTLLLAGACLPAWAQPPALADADLLYCARAYAEAATLLKGDPDPGVRLSAGEAQARALALGASDGALLRNDPARHQRAIAQAQQRLLSMPVAPLEARRLALRAAYVECRYLESGIAEAATQALAAAAAPVPTSAPTAAPTAVPVPVSVPTLVAPSRAATPPEAAAGNAPAARPDAPAVAPSANIWGPETPASRPAAGPAARPGQPASALQDGSLSRPAPVPTAMAVLPAAAATAAVATRATGTAATTALSASSPADTRATASARVAPRLPAEPDRPATPTPRTGPRKDTAAIPAPAPVAVSRPVTHNAAPVGLDDADLVYCTQVYSEVSTTFGDDKGEAAEAAREAKQRWDALSEREHDLLNDHPDRHSLAIAAARPRLAILPAAAGRPRSMALRSAYEDCLGRESRAAAAARPVAGGDRVQMLANRHFCRDLLMRKLKVSPKVRAGFTASELTALEEIQRIGDALAQPMPGAPLTQEQDREAHRLTRQQREALERAAATWAGAGDPVAKAMGQCHDDYAKGLLGGPDVLSRAAEDAPVPATAVATATTASPASMGTPVVLPADLGPVFHMREATPAGPLDGIWIRRGPNLYDAVWVQASNGQMQRDVLEVRGIVDGELIIYRQGYRGSYRAKVRANGTLEPGTASWFNSPAYSWSPLPSQYVRGGDLGAVVHMREVTHHGNYEGIWRQRGQTGLYDVLWVFVPTGEITADVLEVTGVAKGQLIIRRQNGPGLYSLKRRGDTVKGGRSLSQWMVLPAQPVKLGGAAR